MASSYSFQPTSPPGPEGAAPPPPAEGQPSAPPAGHEAPPGGLFGGGGLSFLILALPLLLIFMMTRNQNKKQKQLESSLKTGDRVITQAGLLGKIIELNDRSNRVKLEIAPGVNVQILKSAIQGVDPGETASAGDKSKEPAKDKPQEKKA